MSAQKVPTVGSRIDDKVIAEVGQIAPFGIENYLLPVRYEDKTYAVLVWCEQPGFARAPSEWIPDSDTGAAAIANGVRMPEVQHGTGSDVIHVRGEDGEGTYLVKLYYNEKKSEGRRDATYR